MRTTLTMGLVALAMSGCRESGDDKRNGNSTDDYEVDIELVQTIADEWLPKSNLEGLIFEMVTDAAGCTLPKWAFFMPYLYNPETNKAEGMHMVDMSYPIDVVEENRPRILMYDVEDDGTYTPGGIEWYFEPPGGEPLAEQPTLFNIPMDGMMEPHVPGVQNLHYDLHGWMWVTHPDNKYGYFSAFNNAMEPPDWYFDMEASVFDALKFFSPQVRADAEYVVGDCVDGLGIAENNDAMLGLGDPYSPSTLYTDVNGIWVGSEFTVADDGSGVVPEMFGQQMYGPNEDGFYYIRTWMGSRVNPDGMFAEYHRFLGCSEPKVPVECINLPF